MTLNQMIYFQKIAELGNMGQAARALSISQPSLSVSISNLEKELITTDRQELLEILAKQKKQAV